MVQVFKNNLITVEVAAALNKQHFIKQLQVPEGTTVEQAIKLSMIKEFYPEIDYSALKVGIYSKIVKLENIIQQNDRIEIYRPLTIEPKEKRKLKVKSKLLWKVRNNNTSSYIKP